MVHRYGFEAVVRLIQHLRNNTKLVFGGYTLFTYIGRSQTNITSFDGGFPNDNH